MNSYLHCIQRQLVVKPAKSSRSSLHRMGRYQRSHLLPSVDESPSIVLRFFSVTSPAPVADETKIAAAAAVHVPVGREKAAAASPLTGGLDSTADPMANAEAIVSQATAAATKVQKPRPIFPWRHEPVNNPLPRLTPGTSEYREAAPLHLTAWAQRMVAYWFLNVPWHQALFHFDAWRHDLADASAYAFARGVAAIVSNVYQIPFEKVVASDDDKISFQFPPPTDNDQDAASITNESEDELTASIDGSKDDDELASNEKTQLAATSDKTSTQAAFAANEESPGSASVFTKNESQESTTAADTTKGDEISAATASAASEGASASDTTKVDSFCPQIKDMLIEPLRKLYESAHESGRDQLIIKLKMEPVRAFCYNIVCLPYVTRADAIKNPDKIKRMKSIRFVTPREGFRTVFGTLERELGRSGQLQTTVEVQVLVICNEVFQVIDRESGAVLQGSQNGSEQVVSHLVRLETTAIQEITPESTGKMYYTDWQITDIDDLLGHVAWYQK